jgi:hypothetical protein
MSSIVGIAMPFSRRGVCLIPYCGLNLSCAIFLPPARRIGGQVERLCLTRGYAVMPYETYAMRGARLYIVFRTELFDQYLSIWCSAHSIPFSELHSDIMLRKSRKGPRYWIRKQMISHF